MMFSDYARPDRAERATGRIDGSSPPRTLLASQTRTRNKAHLDIAAPRPPRGGVDEVGRALPAHVAERVAIKARPHIGEIVGAVIMHVVAVRIALDRQRAAGAAEQETQSGEPAPRDSDQRRVGL